MAGCVAVGLVVAAALLHSYLGLPRPNAQNLAHALEPPSREHLFGTDNVGRDVFSRTLAAASLDLRVGVALTAMSLVLGVIAGTIAGYAGGFVDATTMRLVDLVVAFPFLVLVLAVTAIFGPGLTGVWVAVPLVGSTLYARLTRAETLVVRERDYIAAARSIGMSQRRIVLRHVLPNVWRPALVYSASDLVGNIVLLSTLSYLGLGVQQPTAEWGGIIAGGQSYLLTAWWISTLPGLVVVFVGIGFVLIGDALSESLATPEGSSA